MVLSLVFGNPSIWIPYGTTDKSKSFQSAKRSRQDKIKDNEVVGNHKFEDIGLSQDSGIPGLRNINFNTPSTKAPGYRALPAMKSKQFPHEQHLDKSWNRKNQNLG